MKGLLSFLDLVVRDPHKESGADAFRLFDEGGDLLIEEEGLD